MILNSSMYLYHGNNEIRKPRMKIWVEKCKRFFTKRDLFYFRYIFFEIYNCYLYHCVSLFRLFYHLADSCEIANKKSNLTNALFDVSLTMRNHTNQRFEISYMRMLAKNLTQFNKFCLTFYYEWYIEETELLKVSK